MSQYESTMVIEKDEDGVFIASCPALAGCHSQGDTYDEAVENIKDAMKLHIEARLELGEALPVEVGAGKVAVSV